MPAHALGHAHWLDHAHCTTCALPASALCSGSIGDLARAAGDGLKTGWRMVPARQDILRQGDPAGEVIQILSGWACVFRILDDGKRQVVRFALSGDVLGFEPGDATTFMEGAVALTDVVVCVMPRKSFDLWRRKFPGVGEGVLRFVVRDAALANDRLACVGQCTARQRVAHLLLELYCRSRGRLPSQPGETLELPLTQADIGDALGLTAVHVSRTFRILREDGCVEFENRRIRILRPDRFVAEAGATDEVVSLWIDAAAARPPAAIRSLRPNYSRQARLRV